MIRTQLAAEQHDEIINVTFAYLPKDIMFEIVRRVHRETTAGLYVSKYWHEMWQTYHTFITETRHMTANHVIAEYIHAKDSYRLRRWNRLQKYKALAEEPATPTELQRIIIRHNKTKPPKIASVFANRDTCEDYLKRWSTTAAINKMVEATPKQKYTILSLLLRTPRESIMWQYLEENEELPETPRIYALYDGLVPLITMQEFLRWWMPYTKNNQHDIMSQINYICLIFYYVELPAAAMTAIFEYIPLEIIKYIYMISRNRLVTFMCDSKNSRSLAVDKRLEILKLLVLSTNSLEICNHVFTSHSMPKILYEQILLVIEIWRIGDGRECEIATDALPLHFPFCMDYLNKLPPNDSPVALLLRDGEQRDTLHSLQRLRKAGYCAAPLPK